MTWLDDLQPKPAPILRDRRDYVRATRELAAQGLKPRDIADALHITVGAVMELLAEQPAVPKRRRAT